MSPKVNRMVHIIEANRRRPGPAKYQLPATIGFTDHDPRKKRHPAFSFGKRLTKKEANMIPGPYYFTTTVVPKQQKLLTPTYSSYGKAREQPALSPQTQGNDKHEQPRAPSNLNSASSSTVAQIRRMTEMSPAPNAYVLPRLIGSACPVKKSSAAFSLTSRQSFGSYLEDFHKTPGPGSYNISDATFRRHPAFSMQSKTYKPKDKCITPGPGAYNPPANHRMKSAPSYSFGIRYTDHVLISSEA